MCIGEIAPCFLPWVAQDVRGHQGGTRLEEYEINGLRDKLDNLEFRLNGLSADIEELTRRLDESGRRDRDFQRAMWIQTDAGQRYRHWMDTWQPIWNELFCFNVCSTGSAVFFRSVG